MPPSSALFIPLLLLALGCEAGRRERVYVDLAAVQASTKVAPSVRDPLPKPPGGTPAATVSIAGTPGRTVQISGEAARGQLAKNRQRAERELTRALAARYTREVERAGEERIRALDPARREALRLAQEAVRGAFEEYAAQRGPKIARLTSLVGFPDPNPRSLEPSRPPDVAARPRLEEAKRLRAEIAELDAAYERRVGQLLAEVERRYAVNLTEARSEVGLMRAEALERAEREAVREVATAHRELAAALLGDRTISLPGSPGHSARLPAVPPPPAAPQVVEPSLSPPERRQILESQVRLWAEAQGYELAERPRGAKDATEAFISWRKERGL